ncbi:MAG: hypothetical protein OXI87_04935 [Albidovulum sp.]|nr:hypothetical protein [Albidovulum sp.]
MNRTGASRLEGRPLYRYQAAAFVKSYAGKPGTWRQCAPDRYGFIADPLASIALFAEEARRGRPAALEAVNKAKAAMKKAPKAA